MAINKNEPTAQPVYIFDAEARPKGIAERLKELFEFRYLLHNLVTRQLKIRYKNSLLGILWSMLNPLGLMLVFTALFTVLSRGDNAQNNYPIFVLVGLMPWNFFSGTLIGGTTSITNNTSLIKKVYFPASYYRYLSCFPIWLTFLLRPFYSS
jgi:lipopolysaccharide transport system permease protein